MSSAGEETPVLERGTLGPSPLPLHTPVSFSSLDPTPSLLTPPQLGSCEPSRTSPTASQRTEPRWEETGTYLILE